MIHPGAAVNRVTLLRSVVQAKRRSPRDRSVDRLRTAAGVCWAAVVSAINSYPLSLRVGLNLVQQIRQCDIPLTTHHPLTCSPSFVYAQRHVTDQPGHLPTLAYHCRMNLHAKEFV